MVNASIAIMNELRSLGLDDLARVYERDVHSRVITIDRKHRSLKTLLNEAVNRGSLTIYATTAIKQDVESILEDIYVFKNHLEVFCGYELLPTMNKKYSPSYNRDFEYILQARAAVVHAREVRYRYQDHSGDFDWCHSDLPSTPYQGECFAIELYCEDRDHSVVYQEGLDSFLCRVNSSIINTLEKFKSHLAQLSQG